MTDNGPLNVLFLCTHNSARSILAEAVMNRVGLGKFKGYSAGSQPSGKVHPYALDLLRQLNYDTSALRSKSWDAAGQFQALFRGAKGEDLHRPGHAFGELEINGFQFQFARFDLGKIEDIVEQAEEHMGRFVNGGEIIVLPRIEFGLRH